MLLAAAPLTFAALGAPRPLAAAPAAPDSATRVTAPAWRSLAPAPDRLQHAGLSFSLAAGTGIATAAPGPGTGVALAFGVVKEVHDARHGGRFDWGDLAFDAAGAVLGGIVAAALVR